MADRIFERILQQTAADVAAQQEQADPEAQKRKAQVRWRRERPLPAHVTASCSVTVTVLTQQQQVPIAHVCLWCHVLPLHARAHPSLPPGSIPPAVPPRPGYAGHPLLIPSLLPLCLPQVSEEASLRKMTTGMTASDAIRRMLLAYKDRDYFR